MRPSPPPSIDSERRGADLGALLVGYAFLGVQPVFVRLLALRGLGFAEAVLARFAFGALCTVAICLARRRGLRTEQPGMLLLRGLLGGVAVQLYFFSVQEVGAARATLLNYTYPFWANLLALFFGQRVRPAFWFLLGTATLGVALLLDLGQGLRFALGPGEFAGLTSGFAAGASILTLKQLRRSDESLTILASFTVVGSLLSLPFLRYDAPLPKVDAGLVALALLVGATSFFGHLFFTRGYRGVPLPTASALSLSVPFLSTLIGTLVLDEPFPRHGLLGAALLLGALGLVPLLGGARERTLPPEPCAPRDVS